MGPVPLLVQETDHARPLGFIFFIVIFISVVDLTGFRDLPVIVIPTDWQHTPKPSLSLFLLEVFEPLFAEGEDNALGFRILSF